MQQSGPWSSLDSHGYNVFALVVGCVFHLVAKPPYPAIGTLTNVFCTSGPNLVILAWMGDDYRADKIVIDKYTDGHTHTDEGNDDNQRYKFGLWWKNKINVCNLIFIEYEYAASSQYEFM